MAKISKSIASYSYDIELSSGPSFEIVSSDDEFLSSDKEIVEYLLRKIECINTYKDMLGVCISNGIYSSRLFECKNKYDISGPLDKYDNKKEIEELLWKIV